MKNVLRENTPCCYTLDFYKVWRRWEALWRVYVVERASLSLHGGSLKVTLTILLRQKTPCSLGLLKCGVSYCISLKLQGWEYLFLTPLANLREIQRLNWWTWYSVIDKLSRWRCIDKLSRWRVLFLESTSKSKSRNPRLIWDRNFCVYIVNHERLISVSNFF